MYGYILNYRVILIYTPQIFPISKIAFQIFIFLKLPSNSFIFIKLSLYSVKRNQKRIFVVHQSKFSEIPHLPLTVHTPLLHSPASLPLPPIPSATMSKNQSIQQEPISSLPQLTSHSSLLSV